MNGKDLQLDAVAERDFHAKLLQIDGDLHQTDIQALKFLFKDSLQKSKLAKMTAGHDLFTALETTKLATAKDPWVLVEVFKTIGRMDLIDYLDVDEKIAEDFLRTGKISDYRHLLFDIAQDLTKEDAKKLAFLAEKISKAKREKLTSALDLFSLMEESKVISPNSLGKLLEYMNNLGRRDLVDRLNQFTDSQEMGVKCENIQEKPIPMEVTSIPQPAAQKNRDVGNGLPESVRLDLGRELNKEPVSQVTVLWNGLGYSNEELQRLNENLSGHGKEFQVETLLKGAPVLHGVDMADALVKLVNALRYANLWVIYQQLVAKYKDYLPKEFMIGVERQKQGEDNRNMDVSMGGASQALQPAFSYSSSTNSRLDKDTDQSIMPAYKMDANPRGICVIFNNSKFWYAPPDSEKLRDRIGSDIDAAKLKSVFEKLHFEIIYLENKSAKEMCDLMKKVSRNHVTELHDCFVCCVLTHGKDGDQIYGSDGHIFKIGDLQKPVKATNCPQLAGKPKLFFMQACQGQDKQTGMEVQSDVNLETDSSDAVTVPNEADFLLGYATAPGFVSYRSKTSGSWYIGILTELLEKYATRCDLLSILTKVNYEVGKKQADVEGGSYKQSPAPKYTLRKRVIFQQLGAQEAQP